MPRAILVCLSLTCGFSSSLGELINDEFSSLLQSHRTLERDDLDSQVNFGKDGLNWGLTLDHLKKYARWCDEHKVVLIFRQSEKDTLKRIHQKDFKTKSVDVKDKSSNWGLTSGFVPLDVHFSKKAKDLSENPDDKPIPQILVKRKEDVEKAEKADELLPEDQRTGISATPLVLSAEQVRDAIGEDLKLDSVMIIKMTYYSDHYWHLTKIPNVGPAKFATGDFWHVQWIQCDEPETCTPPEKVYVWAYGGAPVTGDYDLWLVAPQLMSPLLVGAKAIEGERMQQKFQQALLKKMKSDPKVAVQLWAAKVAVDALAFDKHGVPGGVSTMPHFLNQLIHNSTLNTILGPPWNEKGYKVINHGAEVQNFYFVQALDKHLTIIVPTELSDVARFLGLKSAKSSMTETAVEHLEEWHHNIWMGDTRSASFANFITSARHLGYLAPLNAEYYKRIKGTDINFVHLACLMTTKKPSFLTPQLELYQNLEYNVTPHYTACIAAGNKPQVQCRDDMKSLLSQSSLFEEVYVIANIKTAMKSAWQDRTTNFAESEHAAQLMSMSESANRQCKHDVSIWHTLNK